MKIKELSLENRPREKMIKNGAESLSNEELMAIIIGMGNKEMSAIELATQIINSVTNIKDLLDLSYYELTSISGIKKAKGCRLLASFELAKRVYSAKKETVLFTTADQIYEHMYPLVAGKKVECFYALYLDVRCKLIEKRLITNGTQNAVLLDIKEVLRHGLKTSCYGIILIHNHPSGISKPSIEDINVTKKFFKASSLLNIYLIDHIIIGEEEYTSLAYTHSDLFMKK